MLRNSSFSKSVLAAAALTVGMTACSPKNAQPEGNKIDAQGIVSDKSLTPAEKADRLASAAERLMNVSSFMYASDVAHLALSQDAKNPKAKFIVALSGPVLALQGVFTRIEPLVKTNRVEYTKYSENLKNAKNSVVDRATYDFLFKAPQDISTEEQAQELIGQVVDKVDILRRTAIELRDSELTIAINESSVQQTMAAKSKGGCRVQETAKYVYKVEGCEMLGLNEVKLNRADFEGIQTMAAGWQTYLTVMNSYNLSGLYSKAAFAHSAPKDIAKRLLSDAKFGTLRANHKLGRIPETFKDVVVGVRYAQKMQSELCAPGKQDAREGHLFNQSICIEDGSEVNQVIALVETVLEKGPTPIHLGTPDAPVETVVNVSGYLKSPVQDVRKLAPFKTSSEGKIVGISDGTFGGLFPNGDANEFLFKNK